MIIEQAFKTKFDELFPAIELFPLVAPAEIKDLYAVYKVVGRSSETDLSNMYQMNTCNIQVFFISTNYIDVANATWDLIHNFEIALGEYSVDFPFVQQVQILASGDDYNDNLQVYQSTTELQFYFN